MKKVKLLKKKTLLKVSRSVFVKCQLQVGDQKLTRYSIEHPGCVVIVPKLNTNRFFLVKQYRYAARDWLWEFPAGGIEKGESIVQAARRELAEEAGYAPKHIKKLVAFFPTPGISEEKMHLFLAWDLKPFYSPKDDDEEFELRDFSLEEIDKMIRRGKILDAKTIIGFFLVKNSKKK